MSSSEAGLVGRPPNREEKQTAPMGYGMDAMFAPSSVAVIGATSRPGTVGRSVLENLLSGKFQGKVYAVNAKHPEVLGLKTYASIRDIPRTGGFGHRCHPGRNGPAGHWRVRGCRHQGRGCDFRWIQGAGRGRRRARAANSRTVAARYHALDGPKLHGHYEPDNRVECHFRQGSAQGGQRRVPESERSAFGRDPRLERPRTSWLQRHRFYRLDARCGLGAI